MWRVLGWLLCLTLFALAAALGLLTLGLLASISGGGPLWLRSLGALVLPLAQGAGVTHWGGVAQALALMGLTSTLAAAAAYVKPRL
ncbi:hypothetical protein C8263_01385 [Deinococcus arcticus]|uniref:Uncharacterized protein n=1 Tax=Deinococcus arcticus TaxID=2136176 RepID=A0A2T3WCT2_9DEIO|nr:hypothetical protein C8263_01385 [Deinococcus arcticus]